MKAKIRELFATNKLGLYPVAVQNGADEYHCPCCDSYVQIKGYAVGPEHIAALEHSPNCELYELYLSTREE